MPEAAPRAPRRDDTAADARSLERMGRIEPQPIPALPELPAPAPADEQEAAELAVALADAGIAATDSDKTAVRALASLDAATVETVKKWLKAKEKDTPSA
ncbi:hypothetical protein ADK57_25650 [Streptomyces sp. MMG1533]|uniref:hypothetical protein n=1 Tax=Streptomyces sp. MMG1533 TaxID=1415546 RepID=UPI0006AE9EFB|nr:hypothetical protein [Streptomyces sp. MMG1533]KOU62032.1 hypothetical protein ADK57_25650 [Streptomyces sp. MMG1533]